MTIRNSGINNKRNLGGIEFDVDAIISYEAALDKASAPSRV